MVMTATVEEELSGLGFRRLRCCGSPVLHIVGGRVVVAAELNAGALARRLRTALGEIYGYLSDGHLLTPREDCAPEPATWCGWSPPGRCRGRTGEPGPAHPRGPRPGPPGGGRRPAMHHRHATLQELGRLADPSLSKDTVAGRLHRLVVPKDMHGVTPGR